MTQTVPLMRLFILLSTCFLFTHSGNAQYAYQLFRPGVQYLYEHQLPVSDFTSPLLGVRLDGAACQVMYESLQPNIPSGDSSCLIKVPSFIGSEICQSVEQTSLNLGTDEDPQWLQLFPSAQPGTSWLATINGNDSIYAKVDNLAWTSVLGLMDSVKTIGFYTRQANGPLIALYDEAPLQISLNYGLIRGVFLHWLGIASGSIDLVGMSKPLVGLQNPDRQNIFQLQTGDELHLLTLNTVLSENSFYHEYREKKTTLQAEGWLNGNSLRYYAFLSDQKIYQAGPAANPDTIFLSAVADTVFLPWAALNYLNEQPGALLPDADLPDMWRVLTLGNRYFCDQPAKRLGAPFLLGNEPCAFPWLDALPGDEFFAPYSGPYYQNTSIGGFRFRILNYAALAGETACGTPYDFLVATTVAPAAPAFHIWPNPVSGVLYLQVPPPLQQLKIEIWNPQGQLLHSHTAYTQNTEITVQHLPAGVYYLRYYALPQQAQTIKFIKQ